MSEIKTIAEDTREIEAIYWDDESDSQFNVGRFGVEKIVAYAETGEYSFVPFLAIYKEGEIWQRVSALKVRIMYKELAK